jgi:putative ABC transport system ATP-binding protein
MNGTESIPARQIGVAPPDRVEVLAMTGIAKRFETPHGPVSVLRDVDFSLVPGDFMVITGPSGSGKTTFLNLASLLDHPTEGVLCFDGQDVARLDEPALCSIRKQHIGMVFQNFYLLPHRTALENVMFRFRYVDYDQEQAREQALAALARVGLRHVAAQPARLLSGGEMQRVAIARAVALEPRLIVADEPTGNLDRASADNIISCFLELNAAGISVLMVTHDVTLLTPGMRHLECRDGRLQEAAA